MSCISNALNFPPLINHTVTHPEFDIAYLQNTSCHATHTDLSVDLLEHHLSFSDFISCFYSQPGCHFNINNANKNYKPLSLLNQSYVSTDGKVFSWRIYNECLRAYSMKNQVSSNTIPPQNKILLTKESLTEKSLANNCGKQFALSWEEVLESLVLNGSIQYTGDSDHNANVVFKIPYTFHSHVLDVSITSTFRFKTEIPCYRNVYNNADHCIPTPYSKAEEPSSSCKSKKLQFSNKEQIIHHDDNSVATKTLLESLVMKDEDDDEEEEEDDASLFSTAVSALTNPTGFLTKEPW